MNSIWVERFVHSLRDAWGPLSTEVVADSRIVMTELARIANEHQIAGSLTGMDPAIELYRDVQYGFVLTAYAEEKGRYRDPHDHGTGWVVYAVVEGSVEMGTYVNSSRDETASLVRRDSIRMESGDAKVFLPGDIHDTLCVSDRVVILRLTSCDLKKEASEGRMNRYPPEV